MKRHRYIHEGGALSVPTEGLLKSQPNSSVSSQERAIAEWLAHGLQSVPFKGGSGFKVAASSEPAREGLQTEPLPPMHASTRAMVFDFAASGSVCVYDDTRIPLALISASADVVVVDSCLGRSAVARRDIPEGQWLGYYEGLDVACDDLINLHVSLSVVCLTGVLFVAHTISSLALLICAALRLLPRQLFNEASWRPW
jgi:hypothetical protein